MSFEKILSRTPSLMAEEWRVFADSSSWHPDFLNLALPRVGQGKCLRPVLMFATYSSLLNSENQAPSCLIKTALALEMLHTYSLVHDDLPCMDDDDFRRGYPTAHREASEATALLLGDALLTGAFEVLANIDAEESQKIYLISQLARLGGAAGLISGQQRDLHGKVQNTDDLKLLHEEKTGALFAFCVLAAAKMALPSYEFKAQETALNQFGKKMGLLFQVADDVLDAGEEGPSFVSFLGLEKTKEYAAALQSSLRSDAKELNLEGLNPLIDLFVSRKS